MTDWASKGGRAAKESKSLIVHGIRGLTCKSEFRTLSLSSYDYIGLK